jgi:hypothetical protein
MSGHESTSDSVCLLALIHIMQARARIREKFCVFAYIFKRKKAVVLISLEISQIGAGKEIFDSEVFDR